MSISIWLIAACFALTLEFFTGSLYLLITAIALAIGGLVVWLGGSLNISLLASILSALVGYVSLSYYRRNFYVKSHQILGLDIGQEVKIIKVEKNGDAIVLYRGAQWAARMKDEVVCDVSLKGYICANEGSTLIISLHKVK